jgi:hypothetical protein
MSTQSPGQYQQQRGREWRVRLPEPRGRGHVHDTETRPFFMTSEFLAYVLLLMGLGITASISPSIDARFFWEWATLATIAYMLSRGFAKSGTRSRAWDPREDMDTDRGNRGDSHRD